VIPEGNFCDGLEMKFSPPLGAMKQVDMAETVANSVISSFYLRLVIASAMIQVCISSSLMSTRSLNLRQRERESLLAQTSNNFMQK